MPQPEKNSASIRCNLLFFLVIILVLWVSTMAGERGHEIAAPASPPYLTVFLLDGARHDVVFRELRSGRLPHIQQLIEQGALVENGVTSFPSMTGYAYYPLVTGHDSSRSGVLGLRWFDRSRDFGNLRSYVGTTNDQMSADFAPRPRLLYERFPHQHSYSFNTYANRGVKKNVKAGFAYARAKYHRRFAVLSALGRLPMLGKFLMPDWEEAEAQGLETALRDLKKYPKIQWVTIASMDAHHHVAGTDDRYAELIRYADVLIGRYRDTSRALGQETDRIYLITTDHGAADASDNLDVREVLASCCGLKAQRDRSTHLMGAALDQPLSDWFGNDAVVVINGDMVNYLYFSDPERSGAESWRHPMKWDRLRSFKGKDVVVSLSQQPGISLVLGWSDEQQAAKVFSSRGEATIRTQPEGLSYSWQGQDPLEYEAVARDRPLLDGKPHDDRAWLDATYGTRFPDAVFRIVRLLTAPGAPDLVLTAAQGWDLGKDYEVLVGNYRGGHGGLRAEEMLTWFVLAGPGIRKGVRLATARTEDVGATLFPLLGILPDPEATGKILEEVLER